MNEELIENSERCINEIENMSKRMKKAINILNQIEDEDALVIINVLLMRMQAKIDLYEKEKEVKEDV